MILLSSYAVSFSQNVNVQIEISVEKEGLLESCIGYDMTDKTHFTYEVENWVGKKVTSHAATTWAFTSRGLITINLSMFATLGGAPVGENVKITLRVVNSSSSLNGMVAVCNFVVVAGGRIMLLKEKGIVFKAPSPVEIIIKESSLTMCEGATTGNTLTAEGGTGAVKWFDETTEMTDVITTGMKGDFSDVAHGNYNVFVEVGGVKSKVAVPVQIKAVPNKPVIKVTPENVCVGEDIVLSVQSPETSVSYAWNPAPSPSTTGPTANYKAVNSSTQYTVLPTLNGCSGLPSDAVSVSLKPNIVVNTPNTVCKVGHYEGHVVVIGEGVINAYTDIACTTPALNINWTGTTAIFKPLEFGVHTFYFKGLESCGVLPVTFDDKGSCKCEAILAISMNGGTTLCAGDPGKEITVVLTSPAVFESWSFNLLAPDGSKVLVVENESHEKRWSYTPTQTGTYKIENFVASDAHGNSCGVFDKEISSLDISVHSKPVLTSFSTSVPEDCAGEDVVLTAHVSDGTAPYEYIWNSMSATTVNPMTLKLQGGENTYTVQIRDKNGCLSEVSEQKTVTGHKVEVTALADKTSILNGMSTKLDCEVDLLPTTNSAELYSWTPTAQIETGQNLKKDPKTKGLTKTETFTVVVTDNNGCTGTNFIRINVTGGKLAVDATGANGCFASLIQLSCSAEGGASSDYKYFWKPSAGLVLSKNDISNPKVDVSTKPGEYTATVDVSDGVSTVTSNEITIIVYPQPTVTLIGTPDIGCIDTDLKLVATPNTGVEPYEYIWTGVDANTATVDTKIKAGVTDYTVQVKDKNTCLSEVSTKKTVTGREVLVFAKMNNQGGPVAIAHGATAALDYDVEFRPTGSSVQGNIWDPANKIVSGGGASKNPTTIALTTGGVFTMTVTDNNGCIGTDEVSYSITGGALSVDVAPIEMCLGEEQKLTCIVNGGSGTGNPEYSWELGAGLTVSSTDIKEPLVTTTGAGTYWAKVTVTKGAQSVTSDKLMITIKEVPTFVSISPSPQTKQVGTTQELIASVNPIEATLIWNGSPITGSQVGTTGEATITAGAFLTAGVQHIYTVTAKNGKCEKTERVVITVIDQTPEINITAENVTLCKEDADQFVSALATGGSDNFSYRWQVVSSSDGGSLQLARYDIANVEIVSATVGHHSLRVFVTDIDNPEAGEKTKDITVTVNGKPTISGIVVNNETSGGTSTTVDYGDALNLVATVTPIGTGCAWSETPGSTLISTTSNSVFTTALTETTTYTVTATTDKGCSATKSVIVTVKESETGAILNLGLEQKCADSGESMVLSMKASGGTSYTFTLKNNKGFSQDYTGAGPWTKDITLNDQDTYFVQDFKAFKNGVEIKPTQVVPTEIKALFYTTPEITIVDGTVRPICEGSEVILSASSQLNGTTYTWDRGVINGQAFTPTEPGDYTVTAVSDKGCRATETVKVSIHPNPTVTVSATSGEICLGDKVTLTAGGAADFEWNNGQTGSSIEVTPNVGGTMTYIVTGTENINGCSNTAKVEIQVNEPPVITATTQLVRTIAIDRDVTFGVEASGKDLEFTWGRWDGSNWMELVDGTGKPVIEGSKTNSLTLKTVPKSWNGSRFRCRVENDCGFVDTVFLLNVKECFDILGIEWEMCEGIRPETNPAVQVDGWYCPGSKISICAKMIFEDTDIEIENPIYKWTVDGLSTDDGRWGEMEFISDSSVLSWIPPMEWQDNITIAVSAYADGACDTARLSYLRLKASPFVEVEWDLETSIDPEKMFCPGDTVSIWVNEGNNTGDFKHTYKWYDDVFSLPEESSPNNDVVSLENKNLVLVMGQKDTWVKVVMTPSPEVCTRELEYSKKVYLEEKEFVEPEFSISTEDTLACLKDEIYLEAEWEDAGENPKFKWTRSVGWDLGTKWNATAVLDEDDMWIKCELIPSDEVCYNTDSVFVDAVQIKAIKDARVFIFADLQGKTQEDEIVIESDISGMPIVDPIYTWYINNRIHPEEDDEEFISDELRHRDSIQLGVNGERICQNKVMSNVLYIDYGKAERDTLLTIYQGETVKDLSMVKPEDDLGEVMFVIEDRAEYGMSTISVDGKFSYIPNPNFIGADEVTYKIVDKFNKRTMEEGTIYITVTDNHRFVVPNLITPNDDGLNDTWRLDFLVDYPDHRIIVFDPRSGNSVFEATNYQNDWDGTGSPTSGYVGDINLINGVYSYVIELGGKNKTILKSWIEIRSNFNRSNYR